MPSRNASAKQRYKRLDRSTEAANGYYTRSRQRKNSSSGDSNDNNDDDDYENSSSGDVLQARINNARPSRYQSPISTRSQTRLNSNHAQSPMMTRSRSRSGSITPRQKVPFRHSPDPKRLAALDEFSGNEDDEENIPEDDDEGYESPTKRMSDYSDDSTVSWLIERQLKGTIDASLVQDPEQQPKRTREKTPVIFGDDTRASDGVIANGRMSPSSRHNNVSVMENISTLKPISEKEEEKVGEPKPATQKSADTVVPEARAEATKISNKDTSFLKDDHNKSISQRFVNPKILITIISIICLSAPAIIFHETLRLIPAYVCSRLQLPPLQHLPPTYVPNPNSSHYFDALNRLSSEVDRRISHVTRDLHFLRTEWSQKLPILRELTEAFHQIPDAVLDPLATPKVNFLSPNMGAKIDRDMTSPTRQVSSSNPFVRAYRFLTSKTHSNGPEAVLEAWNDVGDCWCSPMSHNGMQITIELSKAIVPEEIIVEHIPPSATLDHDSVPKDLELWVQYIFQDADAAAGSLSGSLISYNDRIANGAKIREDKEQQAPQSLDSAAEMVYSTLRSSFPNDTPSEYANDPLLGPTFFKIARWRYDLDGTYHIQSYVPDVVVDVPRVRAVQAVFRTASTWGGEDSAYVCLYRLRIHGHT